MGKKLVCKEVNCSHRIRFQSQTETMSYSSFEGVERWPDILEQERMGNRKLVRSPRKLQRGLIHGADRGDGRSRHLKDPLGGPGGSLELLSTEKKAFFETEAIHVLSKILQLCSPCLCPPHPEGEGQQGELGVWVGGVSSVGFARNGQPHATSPLCPPRAPTEKQGTFPVSETKNWSSG